MTHSGTVGAAENADWRAGVAAVDITPEPGLRMWGYGERTQGATGALDPLMAKALVLKHAGQSVALITLDLGRTPEEPLLEDLRRRTKAACGVEQLFVTASHTHQAPSLESYNNKTNAYALTVIDAMEKLVVEAAEKLQPVTIGVDHGTADYAHNRRRHLEDGRVAMQWRNVQHEATSPLDQQYTVVRLDGRNATPLAVLFHYACHPVVLGSDNLQYSADYAGAACRLVEQSMGGTCMFLQGACGDINPYVDKTPLKEQGVRIMQEMGRALGKQIVTTAAKIETAPLDDDALSFSQRTIPAGVRWDVRRDEVRALLSRMYGQRFDEYLYPLMKSGSVPMIVTTLRVGQHFALVGVPGEFFVDFQLDLKRRSPIANTLLVGYTQGYHAYFPTIGEAAAGGYGGKVATYVEVGAGQRLVDAGLIDLYRGLGQLQDVPRADDFQLLEWDTLKRDR
jgi:hypothetical protein